MPDRRSVGDLHGHEPPGHAGVLPGPRLNVILTEHAQRQLDDLGPPAEAAVRYLRQVDRDELGWMAEPLPSQHGREVWMLWAGTVRVLVDLGDDDLTVQGFGLRPRG